MRAFALLLLSLTTSCMALAQTNAITGFAVEPSGDGLRFSWAIRQGFSTCFDVQLQESADGVQYETVFVYGGICGGETQDVSYFWEYPSPTPNQWMHYRLAIADRPETEALPYRLLSFDRGPVMVFPQPVTANSQLLLQSDWSLPFAVQVMDLQGRTVMQLSGLRSREMALGDLGLHGLHFLRVEDAKGRSQTLRVLF